jgi:hypothetical protein
MVLGGGVEFIRASPSLGLVLPFRAEQLSSIKLKHVSAVSDKSAPDVAQLAKEVKVEDAKERLIHRRSVLEDIKDKKIVLKSVQPELINDKSTPSHEFEVLFNPMR